jgi:hypothetical protein
VGEPYDGAVICGLEGDFDGGRAGWDDGVVLPSPGEDQAMRRVELDELAPRRDALAHVHAVEGRPGWGRG